ncbi:MAG: hypothetical protein GY772_09785, partial [bacterium]|nr:hypothetical protein [bacterium]
MRDEGAGGCICAIVASGSQPASLFCAARRPPSQTAPEDDVYKSRKTHVKSRKTQVFDAEENDVPAEGVEERGSSSALPDGMDPASTRVEVPFGLPSLALPQMDPAPPRVEAPTGVEAPPRVEAPTGVEAPTRDPPPPRVEAPTRVKTPTRDPAPT